ncbi:5-methyltetrahydropteroyltriglutamate--homocysteine methyltransferase [Streptomyces sp. DvalAA-14]|uniref:5-methyltetrahydropteroyltriglutamate-- homocysteine methyltransferase n=1 Tax=unclassified Streptomyces TaxID=2593676 RepID=UPI00081AF5EE|nr:MULTISPECIES: 5-methyltetrahydropteroyltriglutamate--homocysteine methyltransferase [unclassified Streptomyces]MYS20641.1 5-methyltetrahydropteroyltriglutamate--homocysteine methyltransferase [Streptomyces sp. SID4948]SCD73677.1 5-methyltetrahydropteroyltriglutamate--homocysteine methyltransferase [Streptomyces sp. DvalAA-14]
MSLPTEQIGSIPRPAALIDAFAAHSAGSLSADDLAAAADDALRDTIVRLEATGSPVVTDGEQTKSSFATYPLEGSEQFAADGISLPFEDGHSRQLPRLVSGPFRYTVRAARYLRAAQGVASVPVKQAVIAPSALSLFYPEGGVPGYTREEFLADVVDEAEADVRDCLDAGAHAVQLDFTEGRLSVKLDPSKELLRSFVELNNRLLERFSDAERARIGVHTCPGGDLDSTHSLDVDYAELLPDLFRIQAGRVYIQLASEKDPRRVLETAARHLRPDQVLFVGVVDPVDPVVETPEQVRDRVLLAAEFIPVERLGSCDDCGFSPFADDTSTSREVAFAKIAARVEGTALAAERLGV